MRSPRALSFTAPSPLRGRALGALLACAGCSEPGASPADAAAARDTPAATDAGAVIDAPPKTDVPAGMDAPPTDAPGARDVATEDAPPRTGTIRDVRHVVVFLQENRSFDNYFGALAGVRGFADPAAMTLRTGRSVFHQPDTAREVTPFHTSLDCVRDVDHGWATGHDAWHNGAWDRWVPAKGTTAMSAHDRGDLGFYYALADAYTVFDAFFCSVMGPTNPNRMYAMTGTLDAAGRGGGPVIDNAEPPTGYTWTTYPERLESAGVSWRVYQTLDNYDDNALAWFRPFIQSRIGDALFERGMKRVLDLVGEFRRDVQNDTLPQVSWIIAPTTFSEHPPHPISSGQDLTRRILEALASNPAVARSTVFLLSYDENGGFYDHVPPPTPPSGTADEFVRGAPIGFGNRVPMIVISPWSRGGVVSSEVTDHTSVLRFLEHVTGVREPNISAWRRQVAGDLLTAFDFAHPDFSAPVLPATAARTCAGAAPAVPATPTIPAQEPGNRPARALPYQPNATARTACSEGRFYITMANTGTASTHFQVAANRFRTDGPWQYDVAPGATLEDFFSVVTYGGGRYDLTLSGPNGFARQYVGDLNTACGALEVNPALDPAGGTVTLTFSNRGAAPVTFTTTAERYRTDGPWADTVAPGGTATRGFDVATGRGWYALSVTASGDASFRRRFTGRLENGLPGVTGN